MPIDAAHDLLGDLGGTRLRLARRGASGIADVREYNPQDWPSLQAVLADYAPDTKGARLFMSFAKKVNAEEIYSLDQAHKKGAWSFRIDEVKRDLQLTDMQVLHDMQAMGRAIFHKAPVFAQVNAGAGQGLRCMINVGTGLGHAFIDADTHKVHDTFGGHFPPSAVTDEQKSVVNAWQADFMDRTFVFEEILSGRGYARLDNPRLFCEFLGLYANMLCVGMDAFGGVYFTGGVMQDLFADNTFDRDSFLKFFYLNNVPIVDDALCACPVYRTNLPHAALYGLDVYAQGLSDH